MDLLLKKRVEYTFQIEHTTCNLQKVEWNMKRFCAFRGGQFLYNKFIIVENAQFIQCLR